MNPLRSTVLMQLPSTLIVKDVVVEVGELVGHGDHVDAEVGVVLSGQRSSNDVRESISRERECSWSFTGEGL
ncbi:hypothetical protein TorRG33x02_145080 [Trema orientale]|uniref:Uncharacterized protein n=1 Tax=Trema orientale TaxID=63057 RepID=A0A2P5EVV8_TREOI|nr:hypothetical protein TorRG33x02_145080 [Trema orientale]